jgi:hypothetical protein
MNWPEHKRRRRECTEKTRGRRGKEKRIYEGKMRERMVDVTATWVVEKLFSIQKPLAIPQVLKEAKEKSLQT